MKLSMLAPIAACTSMPAELRHGTSRTPPMPMQPINNPEISESATIATIGRIAEPALVIAKTDSFV